MVTQIGIVAGEIWHYLDQQGLSSVDNLLRDLQHPKEVIYMSLGWLAREGHIILRRSENSFVTCLREKYHGEPDA